MRQRNDYKGIILSPLNLAVFHCFHTGECSNFETTPLPLLLFLAFDRLGPAFSSFFALGMLLRAMQESLANIRPLQIV